MKNKFYMTKDGTKIISLESVSTVDFKYSYLKNSNDLEYCHIVVTYVDTEKKRNNVIFFETEAAAREAMNEIFQILNDNESEVK